MIERLRLPRILFLAATCLLLTTLGAFALSLPERNGWVTDQAGILDADAASALATRLAELQRDTGDEVVVVTLDSLQGSSIEAWGNALGTGWNIGRANGQDMGVVLVVAPNDRKVRLAVGYGLGNRIPDSVAASIIADHILPYFRSGNFAGGIKAGVESIAVQLDPGKAATSVELAPYSMGAAQALPSVSSFFARLRYTLTPSHHTLVVAFWVVVAIVVLIVMMLNAGNVGSRRRNGYYDDDDNWGSSSHSSRGWGGSSSSGSSSHSSSGGGGSFGGGASGSW
jgi:uncharacterized protein